jgi:hypothetical protein
MSKKSRRRNKKILGLLAAGLGAAALAKRRKATALNAITAGDIADTGTLSGKAGFEGDVPSAGANVVPVEKPAVTTGGAYLSRMGGAGNRATQIANQKKRAALNLRAPTNVMGPFDYMQPRVPPGGMRRFKHGGRVTGIAKRGFGRALKKK